MLQITVAVDCNTTAPHGS